MGDGAQAGEVLPLNGTSLAADALPLGYLPETSDWTVIVKGTFDLVDGGVAKLAPEQLPIEGGDVLTDPSRESAALYESDLVPFKPRADVLCAGFAHARGGRPITECEVRFGVGSWLKTIRVVGDRHWSFGFLGLGHRKSRPRPFVTMPITFDRAYGGVNLGRPKGRRYYKRNRVGRGYSRWGFGLDGAPLPNLEHPRRRVRTWRSRPPPMSFGPVGRTWQPRLRLTGHFGRFWARRRAPRLPADFDEAYYNCAPDDQQMGYLRCDETVRVENMHPEHPSLRCRLPGVRVRCFRDRPRGEDFELEEVPMHLDTLWVDMESLRMVLVWRGRLDARLAPESRAFLLVEERIDEPFRSAEEYHAQFATLLAAATGEEDDPDVVEAERELAEATRGEPVDAEEPTASG